MAKSSDLENAYALIIGISNYKDTRIPKLNYTRADAEGIFKFLIDQKRVGLKQDRIKVLLDADATLFNIKNAISDWLFKNADKNSVVFIYFAGHGGVEEDRLGIEKDKLAKYMLPFDSVFDNLFASALSNRDFNELLLSIKSKKLVIFMDSCYSGGVSERKARDVKITEDPYNKLAEGEGRLVIAASQPDQRSYEDAKLGHGVFTYNLLEALSGKADWDGDGYVTVFDIYKYLQDAVPKTAMQLAGGEQEPVLRGDIKKDFVVSVNRERFEEIEKESMREKKLSKLRDFYNMGKFSGKQYERLRVIVKTDIEKLKDKDRTVAKLTDDLLSEEISIATFLEDLRDIEPKLFEIPKKEKEIEEQESLRREEEKRREREKKEKEEREKKEQEKAEEIRKRDEEKEKRLIDLQTLKLQAQKLFEEQDYTKAIKYWEEVLNLDSENHEAIEGIKNANDRLSLKEVKKYCPGCGHPNERGLKYCTKCGSMLFKT